MIVYKLCRTGSIVPIKRFRKRMKDEFGEEPTFTNAKGRYLELLNLF